MTKLHTFLRRIFLVGFLFLLLSAGVPAQQWTSAEDIEKSPLVQQALKDGRITPQQLQEAVNALKEGRLPPKAFMDLQQDALRGTLTPAEIETGRALLEQKRSEAGQAKEADIKKESAPADRKTEAEVRPASEEAGEKSEIKKPPETADPFFKKTDLPELPELEIYGHKLFSRDPATFAPITALPVSDDYIVGPGDEIKVLMWGRLDAEYSLAVDNEGSINFPRIGPLTVAGLTFDELKDLIRRKAEAITGVSVNVTMGRLRTIQVFVLGEVKSPGVYSVSALAKVGNALLYSGGPTPLGSLRNIQLKRQGKALTVVDLYDFMLKGDVSADVRLMPGDVVFVPQVGPLVSVSGNVNRPAIYELKGDIDLQTALNMAGGLAPRAFNQRIQIVRAFQNQFQVVLDIPYAEVRDRQAVPLQDGDVVRVFAILTTTENAVYLYGNVLRPGQYAFKEGLRILDLVPDKQSLELDTYFDYALVKRYHIETMQTELIPFELGRLLEGRDAAHNILLKPLDEIYIFNRSLFKDREFALAEGRVRKPGRYLIDQMKIRDLILQAGSLADDAYLPKAELIRVDRNRHLRTIYFDVAAALADDPEHNLALQHEDRVIIHSIWETQWKAAVTIEGEVKQPGEYPLTRDMRLKDLFFKAGNFTRDAYLSLGHLYRTDRLTKDVSIHTFNVEKALAGDAQNNLALQDQDKVVVRNIREYKPLYSVFVNGQVNNPGEYPHASNMTVKDLILIAGNIRDAAYLDKGELTRFTIVDGQQVETSILNFNIDLALKNHPAHNLRLQPLDIVTVKTIPNWWERKKTVTVSGEVMFPGAYPIREDERISDVLERAGGFSGYAYLRGAVFTRESVRKVQQQRLQDLLDKLESDVARLSSAEAQAALSPEDLAAQTQFVSAQKALIAKLKESRASGRVVVSMKPLGVLKGSPGDIVLEDGDVLHIPGKVNTINVLGSVYNPTALIYDPARPELKHYLALTGGPTRDAEEKSMYVVRADGTVISKQSSGWFGVNWDSEENRWGFGRSFESVSLNPGDTVLVPEKIIKPSYMRDAKDITQILFQIAVAAGVTIALF